MNKISIMDHRFKTKFIFLLIYGVVSNVFAEENSCWVEVYEDTQYRGKL